MHGHFWWENQIAVAFENEIFFSFSQIKKSATLSWVLKFRGRVARKPIKGNLLLKVNRVFHLAL